MSTPNETPTETRPPEGLWWCPRCQQWVEGLVVTNSETHDPRYGGCGFQVMEERPVAYVAGKPSIFDIQRAGGIGYSAASRIADLFAALRARLADAERERDEFPHKLESVKAPLEGYIATLTTERDALRAENERLREAMSDADEAIDIARRSLSETDGYNEVLVAERDELRAELAEWKAAFKVDDREGDSRLMATAMGQALDAAVRERDEARRLLGRALNYTECVPGCPGYTNPLACTCGRVRWDDEIAAVAIDPDDEPAASTPR